MAEPSAEEQEQDFGPLQGKKASASVAGGPIRLALRRFRKQFGRFQAIKRKRPRQNDSVGDLLSAIRFGRSSKALRHKGL